MLLLWLACKSSNDAKLTEEVVAVVLLFGLAVSLLPTVAAFFYSVMQASWNIFQCSPSAFILQEEECFSRHLCCTCCQPANRKSSTSGVEVAVTCATTYVSQITKKHKSHETKRAESGNHETSGRVHAWRNGQYRSSAKCVSGKLGEGLAAPSTQLQDAGRTETDTIEVNITSTTEELQTVSEAG